MTGYSPLDDDETIDVILTEGHNKRYTLRLCSYVTNIQVSLLFNELYDEFPFENVDDEDVGNKVALIENDWKGRLRFHILVDE